ncbi:hypothetical protein Tco_0362833 [Tanacetum coccineum]
MSDLRMIGCSSVCVKSYHLHRLNRTHVSIILVPCLCTLSLCHMDMGGGQTAFYESSNQMPLVRETLWCETYLCGMERGGKKVGWELMEGIGLGFSCRGHANKNITTSPRLCEKREQSYRFRLRIHTLGGHVTKRERHYGAGKFLASSAYLRYYCLGSSYCLSTMSLGYLVALLEWGIVGGGDGIGVHFSTSQNGMCGIDRMSGYGVYDQRCTEEMSAGINRVYDSQVGVCGWGDVLRGNKMGCDEVEM